MRGLRVVADDDAVRAATSAAAAPAGRRPLGRPPFTRSPLVVASDALDLGTFAAAPAPVPAACARRFFAAAVVVRLLELAIAAGAERWSARPLRRAAPREEMESNTWGGGWGVAGGVNRTPTPPPNTQPNTANT